MKHLLKLSSLLVFLVVFTTACEHEQLKEDQTLATQKANEDIEDEVECETAFAYFEEGCFLNDGFNRWGWTIGPFTDNYKGEFDIYQAAGRCDINKGDLVGYFEITYDAEENTVLVHYHLNAGYGLNETHFYVGNEKYPRKKNGQFTVAPGKFTETHEGLDGANFDAFFIENVEGEIYFIAHAVVCEDDDDGGGLPTDEL